MIRPRKVAAIARFEFANIAKRWSYLIVTFGLPLFFSALSGGLLTLQGHFLQQRVEERLVYGVVDQHGVVSEDAIWKPWEDLESEEAREAAVRANLVTDARDFMVLDAVVLRRFAGEDEAIELLQEGRLGAVYVVAEDYLESGQVTVYESENGPVISVRSATVEPVLSRLLADRLLRGSVDDAIVERALSPMQLERAVATESGVKPMGMLGPCLSTPLSTRTASTAPNLAALVAKNV